MSWDGRGSERCGGEPDGGWWRRRWLPSPPRPLPNSVGNLPHLQRSVRCVQRPLALTRLSTAPLKQFSHEAVAAAPRADGRPGGELCRVGGGRTLLCCRVLSLGAHLFLVCSHSSTRTRSLTFARVGGQRRLHAGAGGAGVAPRGARTGLGAVRPSFWPGVGFGG